MKRKYRVLSVAVMVLLTILVLLFLQKLLVPKYMTQSKEGAMTEEYYAAHKNNEVIFIGDCEVYENICPVTLWEEYGITSYIRGSAQQLIWQSYYLLEETLKYELPKVVVFNVLSMKYDTPQSEAYNRMTLDGMRWSFSKLGSIRASMTEEESFLSYIFPILRFHSRWNEISGEDFKYLFSKDTVTYNGYLFNKNIVPVTAMPRKPKLDNYDFGAVCYEYLEKMYELCRENNIKLVLMKAPVIYPVWYDEWDERIQNFAEERNIEYYNFLKLTEDMGLDFDTDTYDGGLHLNIYGAQKLSKYFGEILRENNNLTDYRQEDEVSRYWEELQERLQNEL